jgi:hypothetical protein
MKKYLIAVLVVFGIAVGGAGIVYAKPLPFNTKCANDTVFNCTDFAYEYCQYNGVENCDILILYGYNGKAGHAINILKKPFKDDPKSARFFVYEPQNMKDEPITYWDQSINKPKRIPAAAMNDLIVRYGTMLNMTPAQMLARTPDRQYLVLDGDVKYNEYINKRDGIRLHKSFWSDGWFPVNEIRKATDSMSAVKYVPKQKLPKCSDLVNRACVMDAPFYSSKYPYQISEKTKDLQYAGRACVEDNGLPATIACVNNVATRVQKGKDLPAVPLTAKLDTSTYCPLSEISPDRALTFTVDAPQIGPDSLAGFNRYNYIAYLYIDNVFVETKVWSVNDKTISFDATNWRGKAATAAAHNVHVVFEVQNDNGDKILSTKSNTVPMNVGPNGCLLAEFTSHHKVTGNICNVYNYNFVRSATPTSPNPVKADQWVTMPLGANCVYDSVKVVNANLMAHQGFILQPGIPTSSGMTQSRQKIPATNGTYKLTEIGITSFKHTKK